MNDPDPPQVATPPAATDTPSAPPDAWVFENSTPPRLGRLERPQGKFRATFDDGTVTELDALPRRWTEVGPTDFYFRAMRETETLRTEFESDPVAVIVGLLEQLQPVAADKAGIQSVLVRLDVTSNEAFSAAWKKALPRIKKHPHVRAAADKKNAYRYTAEAQTPTESIEDLIRELAGKGTKPERKDAVLEQLGGLPLSPVETAWTRAILGVDPEDWMLLVAAPMPPDAARALVGIAANTADRGAVRFLVEQASNNLQPAIAGVAHDALVALPPEEVDLVKAEVVETWTSAVEPGQRALQRVRAKVSALGDVPTSSIGPAYVAALLVLLVRIRDDQERDAQVLRQEVAKAIARGARPIIEAGAAAAADTTAAAKIGLAVRFLKFGPGSTREAILRGLAGAPNSHELLADPLIWKGAVGTGLVRLLGDTELGPVLASPILRTRYTDAQLERFVSTGEPAEVLALLGADGPLRECVPIDLLTDRVAGLAADDQRLATTLDAIAGEPWRQLLAEREATITESEATVAAAEEAAGAAQREADQLRARVGELQLEAERLRRSSGPQARFDALRTVADILVGLAIWSTHPDRLTPADVTAQASQKAKARGLELIGLPGEAADFNPEIHELLTGDQADRVTIVEPAVTVRDGEAVTTLRYAKVQPADE